MTTPNSTSGGPLHRGVADPRALAALRQLVALLEEHRQLYQRLEALARRQTELIGADDTDGLLAVLAERQGVIDQLNHGHRRLEPARRDWERVSAEVPADEREHVRALLAEVTELAGRLAARDDEDRRRLEARRDQIADEMVSLSRSRRAVAAYGAPGGAAGRATFQDREG